MRTPHVSFFPRSVLMAALSNSSGWFSFTPISSSKTFSKTLVSIPNLSSLYLPSSNRCLVLSASSQSPSPLLEDSPNELWISEFHSKFSILQQKQRSDARNLNQLISDLCDDDSGAGNEAFESYQRAKIEPDFQPDPVMLKLLIRLVAHCIKARKLQIAKSLTVVLESEGEIALCNRKHCVIGK